MSDNKTDENPFSFKHFIKNKKEEVSLEYPEENKSGSRPKQAGFDQPANVQNNELPFPEVGETAIKTRTKSKAYSFEHYIYTIYELVVLKYNLQFNDNIIPHSLDCAI